MKNFLKNITFIEFMIVIAIIAILAMIIVPIIGSNYQNEYKPQNTNISGTYNPKYVAGNIITFTRCIDGIYFCYCNSRK